MDSQSACHVSALPWTCRLGPSAVPLVGRRSTSACNLVFSEDETRTNTGQAGTIESIEQYHYTSGVQILFHRAGLNLHEGSRT